MSDPSPSAAKPPPLPVTLVSGFLGAGKTGFIAHELARAASPDVSALVMTPTAFCPDAGVLRAQLPAGCAGHVIEVRDDDPETRWQEVLPAAMATLAQSPALDRVFVEVSGRLQPPSILKVLPAAAPALADRGLSCRVEHLVTVVDGLDFWHRVVRPTNATQDLPNTPLQRLLAAQVRNATHVLVNKADLINEQQLRETLELIQLISPTARLAAGTFGEVPAEFLASPAADAGELPDIAAPPDLPNPKETSILPPTFTRAVLFSARRPFHPGRFWSLCAEHWPTVMRAKGYFWLAGRMDTVGSLSQSFATFSCSPAGRWWAALPPESWPTDPAERGPLDAAWREPFGDRRQELLLEGEPRPVAELQAALEDCLLTDSEMDLGPEGWTALDDPWPDWELEDEAGEPVL